jgi:ATP-dependent exoDNAse (exonuclease V) beta subunit
MKDVPESVVTDGLREYGDWETTRDAAIRLGSTASLAVRTATEWSTSGAGSGGSPDRTSGIEADGPPIQRGLFEEPGPAAPERVSASARHEPNHSHEVLVADARGHERPGGARFGELVHAVLATAPLGADRSDLDALAGVQGRILAASPDEITAAIDTVERVLAHDLLKRARAADSRGACRRETPVTRTMADGSLVEGVVDLAFEEADGWTIVDYKTDRELAASGEDRYRRQVEFYVSAVEQATGRPASGVLIRV